jgi:hypothetical protein
MNLVPLGFNKLSSFNSAIGLGKGLSTLQSATPVSGGTGYRQGDLLTLAGGTPNGGAFNAGVLRVLEVTNAGAILAVGVAVPGSWANANTPASPNTPTGGAGSGATFSLTFLADSPPLHAVAADLVAEGADVRWRDDGTAPTAAAGTLLKQLGGTGNNSVTNPYQYYGPVQQVQVIDQGQGGLAVLTVVFYGPRRRQ